MACFKRGRHCLRSDRVEESADGRGSQAGIDGEGLYFEAEQILKQESAQPYRPDPIGPMAPRGDWPRNASMEQLVQRFTAYPDTALEHREAAAEIRRRETEAAQKKAGDDAGIAERRHKETIGKASEANRLAFIAILIAVVSLAVAV